MKKIQLSIPEPCHEHWDAMTPTQQGRYCNACAKEVIDFSDMSDTDVLNYFLKKKDDKVCGRAYPDQLDRTITTMPKKKIYWYLNYIIAFVFFFGKAGSSKAQARKGMMLPKNVGAVTLTPFKKTHAKEIAINGVIKEQNGKPISFASIKLLHSHTGTSADVNGAFSIAINAIHDSLEISSLGFETKQVVINDFFEKEIVLTKKSELLKEVMVNSTIAMGRSKGVITSGAMLVKYRDEKRSIINDTVKSWINNFNPAIKIYPNPVTKGNTFNIKTKLKQTGNYTIQIMDAAGRLITEKKINTSAKEWTEQFTGGSTWSAGIYYVKTVDDKGKPAGTASFVIQ